MPLHPCYRTRVRLILFFVALPGLIVAQTGEVTLTDLVAEAQSRHPAIASATQMVESGKARISIARALPDPSISIGWMGSAAPFTVMRGDPSSYRSFAAMQEIPLGGKLGLRGLIAQRGVEVGNIDVELARRQVAAEVKTSYYEYFYFTRALEITARNKDLLQKLNKIAQVRYQVGKATQADVLRSHVELSRLQQKVALLTQQQHLALARLNSALLRPVDTPFGAPSSVELRELDRDVSSLVALAKQNDAELQRRRILLERNGAGIQLARKEAVPDVAVGYMYQQRPAMPDMQGWTFTVNIPVFYKTKQAQMVSEAVADSRATEHSIRDREREIALQIQEQYLLVKAAEKLLKLYAEGIVPQSSLALESSLASYEVGSTDFLTLITNFLTLLDYETEYYRELANQKISLAKLEPIVGVELTR